MSDTNAFDTFEKVEFLFKNYLGYANTQNNKPFFQETEIQTNNYIYGSNVFLDVLPTQDITWNTLNQQETENELLADNYTPNITQIQVDAMTNPIVKKYIKVKLKPVPLSGNQSYYALDQNRKNILQDAIQSNVNKDGSVQPYLYTLYKNDAVTPIPNTETGGNWVFDIKNGVINFVDIQNISDPTANYHISESQPPYLTFVKYVGRKGTQYITDDFDKYDVNFDASGSVLYVANDGKVNTKFPFVNYKSERPNTGISGELFLNTDNQGYLEYYTDQNTWKRIGVEVHHGLQKNDLGAISVTSDISLNDVSLNTLSYYTDSSQNINVEANLVPPSNQLFNLGSSNSKWENVYGNNLLANFIEVNDVSTTDISAVDISATTLTVTDISAVDISAVDISASNISTSNLNAEDILSVTFQGTNLGSSSDPFEKSFITDLSASNLGTINDTSNNLHLKSNLIPSGIKDASNIIQISLGDDQNIFNSALINDISLNRIGYLSDTSKNIMVNGHLIPSGPYDICRNIINGETVEFNLSNFSLGSFNNRWRSLYVSDQTIWIGQSSISTKSTTTTDAQGREKTTIELLFIPEAIDKDDEDSADGSGNNTSTTTTQPTSISIAKGEFLKTIETEIDPVTNQVIEVETFVPIEDSFAIGNLLELGDVDISKNELQDGNTIVFDSSNEKFIIGPNLYVNNKFQTFEEILTQQPLNFTLDSSNNGTGQITLRWNYDDILAMDAYGPRQNALETLPKRKMIPFIDKIHVDISGVIDPDHPSNNDNVWLNYNLGHFDNNGDYAIADNDNYDDGDTYKKLEVLKQTATNTDVQKILSRSGSNNSFSFRIYGINNAYDDNDIIDERSLYVYNTFFTTAETPLAPYYISASQIQNTLSNDNKLSVTYSVDETEKNNPTSLAGIIEIASSYKEFERSVSAHSLAVQADVNTVSTQETHSYSNDPIGANENITWEQTELKPGTSYQFRAKVKNNLNDQFGDLSGFEPNSPSIFTDIPITTTSNKMVTFQSPASPSLTNIFSPNFTNNNGLDKYYINLSAFSDNEDIFTPTISSNSGEFEITTDTVYGASIDNKEELITLKVYKDYDSQNASATQTYQFHGYNTASNLLTFNNVVNHSSDPKYLQIETFDQYYDVQTNTTNANVGFRLNGRITINGIEKQNCNTLIGGAQTNPHILRYELTRSNDVESTGNMSSSRDYELYIDELSGPPTITSNTSNVEVTSVKYTMGIASVKTMTINIERTYGNCNSNNKFIVGNRIVGSVAGISNTNFSQQNKLLTSTDINNAATVGEYTHNISKTDAIYSTNGFTNGINNSLTVSTSAFNLNSTTNGGSVSLQSLTSNQTILNHFYDRLSYANDNSSTSEFVLTTTINSITKNKISQIDTSTINNLGSNIGSITSIDYINHIAAVNDCTLLYIGGKFQSNLTFIYPDTSQINYDNVQNVTQYTHGAISYALDGTTAGLGTKYKWICLNAFQNGSYYNILGTDISIHSLDGVNYIDLNTVLSNYFGATVRDAIFSSSDDWAVCFVTSTKVGTTNKVMATPQGGHSKSSPWYNEGTGTVSWNDIINTGATYNKYKCKVSSYGISVDNTALNDDLQIFIGVKNE